MSHCAHTGKCGGCTHYAVPYAEEISLKEGALREVLGGFGHLLTEILPAPVTEGYRNKMELAFGDEGGPKDERRLALGIRKKRSFYEVATTENCVLMPDDFKQIAVYAADYFRAKGESFYHRKAHVGTLRHLVLRRGHFTGEILVMLSTASGLAGELTDFVQGLRDLPLRGGTIIGILHLQNDGAADAVKNEHVTILWGRDFYREKLCGLTFYVSAFSFFQTNSPAAEVLYDVVRGMAAGENANRGLAYDLYCGTGTIAQIIAPHFERVVGIELSPEAIAAAEANAKLNGISNCAFHAHDITRIAAQEGGLLSGAKPDAIIADPPRDGLSPKALLRVADMNAERLVYVACKPASLARDLHVLVEHGYTPERITGVDLFPRTPHVEAVCLLRKI